ncbi:MAG: FAD-binding oxidoreductase [Desulfobacteraceae bacterium]|nr:FAD-binding oxidoreductase [Desulfobacteraceae bacterium]
MRRWNGWGDEQIESQLPAGAQSMLESLVGRPAPQQSTHRQELTARVPDSRVDAAEATVSADPGDRLDHAHGQSFPDWVAVRCGTLSRFPDAVAKPESESRLEEVLAFADKHQMTVVPYGGGTSVVGHLDVPESDAPVLSLSLHRLNQFLEFEPENRLATFGAGVSGPDLEAALRSKGYTLGHYPQSFEYSTLGGWVVTRSSGQQSRYFGRIEELFAGGSAITPRGNLQFPPFPASAAGPDLRQIFLGSEGRLGILSRATVRVQELPETDEIYGVFFPTWEAGVSAVRELAAADLPLSMIRLSNPRETMTNLVLAGHETEIAWLKKYLRFRGCYDDVCCMLLLGMIGPRKMVAAGRKGTRKIIRRYRGVPVGRPMGRAWRKNRFLAPYLRNTLWGRGYAVDTLETAVTWDRVNETMQDIEGAISGALEDKGEKVHVFTHLSHVYTSGSSIYTTYLFRIADTPEETLARWQTIKAAASRAIVANGGTISHQHGVGVDHKPYLSAEKGALGMDMLRNICTHVDPDQRMNPGKLVDTEEF